MVKNYRGRGCLVLRGRVGMEKMCLVGCPVCVFGSQDRWFSADLNRKAALKCELTVWPPYSVTHVVSWTWLGEEGGEKVWG